MVDHHLMSTHEHAALGNAIAFWKLLMPVAPTFARPGTQGQFTQHQLDMWEKFLTTQTGNRAISKDTWMLASRCVA